MTFRRRDKVKPLVSLEELCTRGQSQTRPSSREASAPEAGSMWDALTALGGVDAVRTESWMERKWDPWWFSALTAGEIRQMCLRNSHVHVVAALVTAEDC